MLIGQADLINFLFGLDDTPKLLMLVGDVGSGRRTLLSEYYTRKGIEMFHVKHAIQDVREAIRMAYTAHQQNPVVYIIADADRLSNDAKNTLLKVTEEPPENVYFAMTIEDENNMLDTIKSRSMVCRMEDYTTNQLLLYCTNNDIDKDAAKIASTPGEINLINQYGVKKFYDYVYKVYEHLSSTSLANAFKITTKIALKDGEDGYDLKMFWKMFVYICGEDMKLENSRWVNDAKYISITSNHMQALTLRGLNKSMLFVNWLFDIREA